MDLRLRTWSCGSTLPNVPAGFDCSDPDQFRPSACEIALIPDAWCVLTYQPALYHPYGVVQYTHGPGLDQPGLIDRYPVAVGREARRAVVPLTNDRGDDAAGADLQGSSVDGAVTGSSVATCFEIAWPAGEGSDGGCIWR